MQSPDLIDSFRAVEDIKLSWSGSDRVFKATNDSKKYEIRRTAERWRLIVDTYSVFESERFSSCVEMADFIALDMARSEIWRESSFSRIERDTHMPGVTMSSFKIAHSSMAEVVLKEHGENVGGMLIGYNSWKANFVIGEPTICSGSKIRKDYLIGEGLGRAMYDLAEETFGIPLVPHGVNHSYGTRSPDSIRFWEKRSFHQRVPGMNDPEADVRNAILTEAIGFLENEERNYLDPYFALAVAEKMGCQKIETVVRPDNTDRPSRILESWCVVRAPQGYRQAFTSKGIENRRNLLDIAKKKEAYFGYKIPAGTIAQHTPEKFRKKIENAFVAEGFSQEDAVEAVKKRIEEAAKNIPEIFSRYRLVLAQLHSPDLLDAGKVVEILSSMAAEQRFMSFEEAYEATTAGVRFAAGEATNEDVEIIGAALDKMTDIFPEHGDLVLGMKNQLAEAADLIHFQL